MELAKDDIKQMERLGAYKAQDSKLIITGSQNACLNTSQMILII